MGFVIQMPSLIELVHGSKEGIDKIVTAYFELYKSCDLSKSHVKRMILECAARTRGEIPLPPVDTSNSNSGIGESKTQEDGVKDDSVIKSTPIEVIKSTPIEVASVIKRTPIEVASVDTAVPGESTAVVPETVSGSTVAPNVPIAPPTVVTKPTPTCTYFGTARWIVKPEYLEKYSPSLKVSFT